MIRTDGLASFCVRSLRRLQKAAVATNAAGWYRADLTYPLVPLEDLPETHVRFDATENVMAWLAELSRSYGWVYVEAELATARKWGHVYGLLEIDGHYAGYVKIGFSHVYIGDFDRAIAIPQDTAFIYDTFIHPEYRRRGLGRHLIGESLRYLHRQKKQSVWCHIPDWNTASIRAFGGNNFKKMGHIRYLRIARWGFTSRNPETMLFRSSSSSQSPCAVLR